MTPVATAEPSQFVTTAEAARILSADPTSVSRLIDQGDLPALRVKGCRIKIPRAAVEALLVSSISGPTEMFGLSRATG